MQENIRVTEGTNDRDFIVGTSSKNSASKEIALIAKILETGLN